MKLWILSILSVSILSFPLSTFALSADPDAPADAPVWEVQNGSADVTGEESVTPKDSRAAWKKACEDWKKEFRQDNKENKIISMDCGTPSCSGEVGSKTCTSKATYKIKTKVN